MMQDEAMSMSNEQAIQILKPMRDMMRDQHGCPISDAYFAVDKAIHALQTISPDEVRGVGKWIRIPGFHLDHEYYPARYQCDQCKHFVDSGDDRNYCPSCGARMKGADA